MTVSHDEKFSRVHSPSAVWVQSVTTRGFEVCARESGIGSNGTGIINWLAFQGHPQMTRGSVTFSGMWTTEAKCDKINLSQVRWKKKKKRLRSTLRVFFVLSHALGRYFAEVVLQKLKWKMTLGARFDFFLLKTSIRSIPSNTSCETFPFVPFESCFHMIIIYQTYQDKVNQCGESGLSVLLTQIWLDITRRFNLFVFIDQDMFMYQSTKKLFQIGKTIVPVK